ncbi:MAG: sulfurtransferase TusB [Methylococcaceae bacterium]|nr:sulfurtransferase TusB [Methylococcaceae bacterium]
MLHLISQITVDECILQRIAVADVVVLLDGAVLKALSAGNKAPALINVLIRARCCVLLEHLLLYGIAADALLSGIEIIDYAALVDLTLAQPLIQTWH